MLAHKKGNVNACNYLGLDSSIFWFIINVWSFVFLYLENDMGNMGIGEKMKAMRFIGYPFLLLICYWIWALIIGLFSALVSWDASFILKDFYFWTKPEFGGVVAVRVICWIVASIEATAICFGDEL